ncbi:MAG: FAD-binding oxidoreductase [Candidatus Absconditicoccaceae bacterium]
MQKATLVSKTFLNDQVIELKLKTEKLATQPGQRLFIHYLESETPLKRAYSIANEEQEGDFSIFTFLIKLIPGGLGSERLRIANEQTKFGLEGPNGHFLLKDTTNPKVFLSTGSGLAPCYRMAKEDKSGSQKRFFFSVSYAKDLFYGEEIKNLNIPETHISISREEVEGFEYGRINIDHIDFPAETEFYICGVPLMVKEFLTNLKARGYKNIFVEAY